MCCVCVRVLCVRVRACVVCCVCVRVCVHVCVRAVRLPYPHRPPQATIEIDSLHEGIDFQFKFRRALFEKLCMVSGG